MKIKYQIILLLTAMVMLLGVLRELINKVL
jgi:hypothetical protein